MSGRERFWQAAPTNYADETSTGRGPVLSRVFSNACSQPPHHLDESISAHFIQIINPLFGSARLICGRAARGPTSSN